MAYSVGKGVTISVNGSLITDAQSIQPPTLEAPSIDIAHLGGTDNVAADLEDFGTVVYTIPEDGLVSRVSDSEIEIVIYYPSTNTTLTGDGHISKDEPNDVRKNEAMTRTITVTMHERMATASVADESSSSE